jgi:hypothetical protein
MLHLSYYNNKTEEYAPIVDKSKLFKAISTFDRLNGEIYTEK